MSTELKLSSLTLLSAFSLFAYKTSLETATFAVVSVVLVAIVVFIEKQTHTNNDDIKAEIKTLRDRLDGMALAKGLGR